MADLIPNEHCKRAYRKTRKGILKRANCLRKSLEYGIYNQESTGNDFVIAHNRYNFWMN